MLRPIHLLLWGPGQGMEMKTSAWIVLCCLRMSRYWFPCQEVQVCESPLATVFPLCGPRQVLSPSSPLKELSGVAQYSNPVQVDLYLLSLSYRFLLPPGTLDACTPLKAQQLGGASPCSMQPIPAMMLIKSTEDKMMMKWRWAAKTMGNTIFPKIFFPSSSRSQLYSNFAHKNHFYPVIFSRHFLFGL